MHQSNNAYLKDRQKRPVFYSSKVNITRTKMLGETRAIKSLPDKRYKREDNKVDRSNKN